MKNFLLWTWELPQTLLGCLLIIMYNAKLLEKRDERRIYSSRTMPGGISLGKYIIIDSRYNKYDKTKDHEYGHCIQSSYLGWLYLPIVGVCSILNAGFGFTKNYYDFWTEKWADKLGGVER